jgi:hypothetical protein
MTRPPFPSVVDSTMLSAFRACPTKFFRQYMEHWKPGAESVHLIAGGAFAEGIELARRAFYVEGRPPAEAHADGLQALWRKYGHFETEDSPKSATRMAGALEFYFERYPLGADGATPHRFGTSHGIEFSFAEPLEVLHPESGDPILYSGRADMVADALGGLFLYDEKTTSQLGASWVKKWDHRSQFTAYCWGLRGHGIKPTGIVVRGISILKDSYDTQQAVTYRSDWELDRWLGQTQRDVRRMIDQWQRGEWDVNLDDSCLAYGGCSLTRICKSPDPEKWLPLYFHKRRWDPLTRTETKIEEVAP